MYPKCFWPYRLGVRTRPFQGCNPGANPGRVTCARLAQLVERLIDVEKAIGSNPIPRTKMLFYFLALSVGLLACLSFFLYMLFEMFFSLRTEAPFLNTPKHVFDRLIKVLELKDDSIFYDLGCGDARFLQRISVDYPHLKMVGVEISFLPYLLALYKTRKNKNITVRRENIYDCNIFEATHIFTYLSAEGMEKLMPVLERKCKPGTVVVSCDFEDKNRKASEIIDLDTLAKRGKRIIVYKLV